MSNQIVQSNTVESVVIGGDLSKLTPDQRVSYYHAVCKSVGLNPLTKPFDYINLNGRLTLYARKDAADQLRSINGVSIGKPDIQYIDEWIVVTVTAQDRNGRTDSDVGVVNKKDMRGDFGNALMKAVTKAKRRVTLSICGLGWLDETEVETIPDARPVVVDDDTGEIMQTALEAPAIEYPPELAVVTNSDGIPYVDLPTDKLSYMANGIGKALAKAKTEDEKAILNMKAQVIRDILAIRVKESKQP